MQKTRVYFIYKYTFPNGKIYIGQTYKGSGRYGKPDKYKGSYVGNAMNKYPNFEKEIIEYCSKDNVDDRERYYINFYNSTNRMCGYNRDHGGNCNKQFTNELRQQLSEIHTNLQVTKIQQFDKDGNFLKEWGSIKEAANKLSIDRSSISKVLHGKAKYAGGYIWKTVECYNPYNSRSVLQYDLSGFLIKEWKSVKEAEEKLHIRNIVQSINKGNKTCGGFQWKYKGSSKLISAYKANREYKGKHVFQYDLNGTFIKEWNSYVEASKYLKIPQQHIKRVLDHERRMTGGFLFSYERHDTIPPYNKDYKAFYKSVDQYTLDGKYIKTYKTIELARQHVGLKSDSGILACCKKRAKKSAGFQWKYTNDNREIGNIIEVKEPAIKIKKERKLPANAKAVKQLDIEGNIINEFSSIASAARRLNISPSSILDAIKGRQKTSHGFIWKYK